MAKKNTYHAYLRQKMGQLIDQLELPALQKETLKERWLDQVVWADKKADQCRRWHYRLRLTTIVGGVMLPALVGVSVQLGTTNPNLRKWLPNLAFGLSQVIAVSAAIEEFCRFGDRWRDYRRMSEDLKAEGWQYLQASGPYEYTKSSLDSYTLFAGRVESIIKNDVQNYIADLMKQQAKQDQEVEQIVQDAKGVSKDKTIIAQMDSNYRPVPALYPTASGVSPMAYPNGMAYAPGYPPVPGYPGAPGYPAAPGYPGAPGYPSTPITGYPYGVEMAAATGTGATAGPAGILTTRQDTVFKLAPQPSQQLPDHQKVAIANGTTFGLITYQPAENNHLYITLTQGIGTENRNAWFVYTPHVEMIGNHGQPLSLQSGNGSQIGAETAIASNPTQPPSLPPSQPNPAIATPTPPANHSTIQLPVPYLSQLDNTQNPYGSCNVTSIAMCLVYLGVKQKNPQKQFEDELQDWLESKALDRHSPQDLAAAVKTYGAEDNFTTTASLDQVKQWLAQGNPCVTHGYFTGEGHIVAIIGYNDKGLIVHDPYGEWHQGGYDRNDSTNPEKGKTLTYSYDMIRTTCMTGGEFWVHFISNSSNQPAPSQPTASTQSIQPFQLPTFIGNSPASSVSRFINSPSPAPSDSPASTASTESQLITADQLVQIGGSSGNRDRLREFASAVNETLNKYQINTPLRIAHFLAQVMHESGAFQYVREIWGPTDWQVSYEGREDLGNSQPGDGKRFMGRGLIQLTGRANYGEFSKAMGVDFVAKPELVEQPPYAVLVAGWYWNSREINHPADGDDLEAVTRLINGGTLGIEDRAAYLQTAKSVLKC